MNASMVKTESLNINDPLEPSLEGEITHHGLADILQFLEAGSKTGLLNLQDQKPVGLIQFERGIITFAHTYLLEGYDAVLEALGMKSGVFRFYPGKEILDRNCRLNATHILLIWAAREDEKNHLVAHA